MDINKLLEFEQNCKEDLALIESSINEFNIFKVLGVHRREIRHSNFLGWLFDPNESHNLKSRFLIDLLEVVKDSNPDYKPYINELLEKDFKDTIVRRESENNIDVFILNRQLDFVICIENKVDADYSPDQLEKYYNHIETNYKYIKTRFYVTLTPLSSDSHKKFKKGEKFSNITYQDILKKFKKHNDLNNNQDNTIPESIRQSIK